MHSNQRGRVPPGKGQTQSWLQSFWQIFLTLITFVWFLAVIKVFLLGGKHAGHATNHHISITSTDTIKMAQEQKAPTVTYRREEFDYTPPKPNHITEAKLIPGQSADKVYVPRPEEWEILRDTASVNLPRQGVVQQPQQPQRQQPQLQQQQQPKPQHILQIKPQEKKELSLPVIDPAVVAADNANAKPAEQLLWPPVLDDGSIPQGEGYEIMPLTGIKVPRFWKPSPEEDLFKTGRYVDGQETIFLMIASYRDFQCRETITSAFLRSDHPERLFVGAVDQVVDGDIGCLDIDIPCSQDPSQMICKYRSQIAVYKMDAQFATGPVTARHIGDRMYRGEYFVMQMDAHCLFVNHWDTYIIQQWRSTGNEMAVLSSYLTDVQGSISPSGDSLRNTRPIMCNSDYEGIMPARYLRHGSQPEEEPIVKEMPMLQPFWAAGFSFSRGHFKVQVPYDGYQPMVFQGEEIAIGIRGFTYGYDFYAPRDSVVFHEYAERSKRRKTVHMFWENSNAHKGEGQKSLRRATHIVGMAPDLDPSTYDHTEEERYGLGKIRPLSEFYRLFLIDAQERKAVQLCPFVRSGKMHKNFQKYLKSDRLGIDYSQLLTWDTGAAMGIKNGKKLDIWDPVPKR